MAVETGIHKMIRVGGATAYEEKKQGLQRIDNNTTPALPSIQELPYIERNLNKRTGAEVVTMSTPDGVVKQFKHTKTGGQIAQAVKASNYSSKDERDASIRDLDKNGIMQKTNALAHNVSQATVSNVVNKKKK